MTAPPAPPVPPARPLLTRTVLGLGLVSLCTDAASDMIWPLLPVLLADTMHQSAAWAGVIEGVADAVAAAVKYAVGRRSDRIGRRKPYIVGGYAVSSIVRPLLALASLPVHALLIRVVDRVGKGVRTAPRDALLAQEAPPEGRATVFGFHRAMDNLGALIGPLLALGILALSGDDPRAVARATIVPGALALFAALWIVREPLRSEGAGDGSSASGLQPVQGTAMTARDAADPAWNPGLRRYLTAVGLFALANASDVFLIAQARRAGASVRDVVLLWAGLSAVRAVSTVPGGALADRFGRRRALQVGWGLYAFAYAVFPLARGGWALAGVTLVYGLYYGLTEGAEKALVARWAPPESLGRAYGALALVTGIGSLAASLLFALLFSAGDGRWAFWTAAALALAAAVALGSDRRPA
jgi:MFS family permease